MASVSESVLLKVLSLEVEEARARAILTDGEKVEAFES